MLTKKIFFILFAFNCFAVIPSEKSEHHVLAVGQGECSVTITKRTFNNQNCSIAVIADAGSSSFIADSKFVSSKGEYMTILELKNKKKNHESPLISSSSKTNTELNDLDSQSSLMSLTEGSSFKSGFSFLEEQIQNIDYWFVFLSHTDEDHINNFGKVLENVLNKKSKIDKFKLKIVFIAGGEWFKLGRTNVVKNLTETLQKYSQNTFALFPYDLGVLSIHEIAELSDEKRKKILKGGLLFRRQFIIKEKEISLDKFSGSLKDLADVSFLNPLTNKTSCLNDFFNFKDLKNSDISKQFLQDTLKRLNIWSLDYPEGNSNARSLVWSYTVPDLNMSFIHTGDAEENTFAKIKGVIEKIDPRKVMEETEGVDKQKHLVFLQGLHHGSKDNYSETALDLFKPDAVIFSAGNGGCYPHPDTETIMKINKKLPKSEKFWDKYAVGQDKYYISTFSKKGDGTRSAAKVFRLENGKFPIFCTNTFGTIKINENGFSVARPSIPGYRGYFKLRAYKAENIKEFQKTFSVDDLININYNDYFKDKTIKLEKKEIDYAIYRINNNKNDSYKLKAVKKGNDLIFYILEKLKVI